MTGAALGRASVYFVTISGGLGLSVAAAFLCVCISLNRYIMSIRWSDGFQGWPFHVFIRPPIFLCLLCKRRREREGKRGRGREIETDRLHRLPTCNRWHSRLPLLPHPWPSQPDAFEYSEGEHFVVLELVGLSATGRHACFFPLFFSFFSFVSSSLLHDPIVAREGREMKNDVDVEIRWERNTGVYHFANRNFFSKNLPRVAGPRCDETDRLDRWIRRDIDLSVKYGTINEKHCQNQVT